MPELERLAKRVGRAYNGFWLSSGLKAHVLRLFLPSDPLQIYCEVRLVEIQVSEPEVQDRLAGVLRRQFNHCLRGIETDHPIQ